MAADDEKTTVEVNDETKAETKPKGGSRKLIIFGGIGFLCVVIGVVLALFVVGPMMSDSGEGGDTGEASEVQEDAHGKTEETAEHKPKLKKKKKKSESDGEAESLVYAIKDIVVNPAGTGGQRFLSVSFGFELSSTELATELETREPVVRDALITILSSKTVAQLTDTKHKEIIRYQIKKRVEQLLNTDELEGVYYTDFVLQ